MSEETAQETYKDAFLAIEYRPDAKAAFEKIQNIPDTFKVRFLKLLEQNPTGPVSEYLKTVETQYADWLMPYEDDRINAALNEVRELGPKAEKEFKKVVETLGKAVDPDEVAKKIKENPALSQTTSGDPLEVLLNKYECSSEDLMQVLGIKYVSGTYEYSGKRFENFVEAAIMADQERYTSVDLGDPDISVALNDEESFNEVPQERQGAVKDQGDLPKVTPSLIPVEEFSKSKSIPESEVIQMIRDASLDGRIKNGKWFVQATELQEQQKYKRPVQLKETKKEYQKETFITVERFASLEHMSAEDVINSIRNGTFNGYLKDNQWYISPIESKPDTNNPQIGNQENRNGGVYAGFWKRAAAYGVDFFVLLIPMLVVGLAIAPALEPDPDRVEGAANALGLLVGWLYFAFSESSEKQASIGKLALGIVVTDQSGERISFGRASGRYVGKLLSALIVGVGFLMVAFTPRKQALHDMLAKTLVINKQTTA